MPFVARRRAALFCSASVALALTGLPGFAQEVDSGTFLGRIIFSFGEPRVAIDTPQSVSVLNEEDIERFQPRTIGDALQGLPGVHVAGGENPLGLAFNIRGIGKGEESAAERRIAIRVDGAPRFYEQYRMGSFFSDPDLYRRVEVLRGPASSTLYGAGALGGVISFTTRDPSDFLTEGDALALRARLGYQSNGDAMLGSLIAAQDFGSFQTLTSLSYRISDDLVDGDGNVLFGTANESFSGLVKGVWDLDGGRVVRLSLEQFDSDVENDPYSTLGSGQGGNMFGDVDRHTVDRSVILSYNDPFEGNDWLDLTAQLSWVRTTVEQSNHVPSMPMISCATSAILCDSTYSYDTLIARVENRADMSGANWENHLTFGAELSHQVRDAEAADAPIGTHPEGTETRLSLYAQSEFVLGNNLTIIPGIRADWSERDTDARIPGAEPVSDIALSPKVALIYEISDMFSVFGSVAQTERLPTIDEIYTYAPAVPPSAGPRPSAGAGERLASLDLEKETSLGWELGFAVDAYDLVTEGDSLQVKLTYFRNDVENLIATAPTPAAGTSAPYMHNIDNASYEGYELELGYDAGAFFAQAAYSSVDARNSDTGVRLSTNPQDLLVTTLGVNLADGAVQVGWRGNFASDISIGATDYEGYTTHDLFMNWQPQSGALEGLNVGLAINNVSDEVWRSNLSSDNGAGQSVNLTLTHTF